MLETIFTAGVIAIIGGIISYQLQKNKFEKEFKTQLMADKALEEFLNHIKFKRRSFKFIRKKMGGFKDDELRKMLVRAGAVRSYSKTGKEWWELLEVYLEGKEDK